MTDVLVLVAGAGYARAQRVFPGSGAEIIEVGGSSHKLNIGAATALKLVEGGFRVCMLARHEDRLSVLREYVRTRTSCSTDAVSYAAVDLLDSGSVAAFVAGLPKTACIWLVHSVGLGAGAYTLKGANPYVPFEKLSPETVCAEFNVPVTSLLLLMQALAPTFERQHETRVVVVTSMSAIRPYKYGFSHSAAKAALHHAVRSLALEYSIRGKPAYISEVLPGIVDTGMYDSEDVIAAVRDIASSFGTAGNGRHGPENLPCSPPSAVGEVVSTILRSQAHILSVSMVAQGQFVNMGA